MNSRREGPREIGLLSIIGCSSGGLIGSGALDGCANPDIGAAAADIASHGGINVRIIWRPGLREQGARGHDLSRLAIAALHDLEFQPCLLYARTSGGVAYRFDRGDGVIADRTDRQNAGAYRLAIEMHRAGSALRDA